MMYLLNSVVKTVKIMIVITIHDSKFNTGPRLSLETLGVRATREVMLTTAIAKVLSEYSKGIYQLLGFAQAKKRKEKGQYHTTK